MSIARILLSATVTAALIVIPSTAAFAKPRTSPTPTIGYDVSYPQCGGALPNAPAFGIVGVSDGLAYGQNPCLATQYKWATTAPKTPAFYMNTGNPSTASTRVNWFEQTGPEVCGVANEAGCAYDYGYNGAKQAFEYAVSQTSVEAAKAAVWWLDVETANSWSTDQSLNVRDIQGSIDFLAGLVAGVGIYSTSYQWGQITGGAQLGSAIPNWVAGALNAKRAPALCSSTFSGGPVALVQYPSGGFDADHAC
jgi:hypothetical protein